MIPVAETNDVLLYLRDHLNDTADKTVPDECSVGEERSFWKSVDADVRTGGTLFRVWGSDVGTSSPV